MDKILGPGNQYVTAAKMLLQNSEAMIAMDMPAGPSEVRSQLHTSCTSPSFRCSQAVRRPRQAPCSLTSPRAGPGRLLYQRF